MSLPAPQLDDRTFDDLLRDAKRRIAEKCPTWTDFNTSDPGMVLVELMAWLTETMLWRLNRVPEKNYVKFLELIGVRLKPAQSARTWVQFTASGADGATVPQGTKLSTRPLDGKPVRFVTCRDINLMALERFTNIWTRHRDHSGEQRETKVDLGDRKPSSPAFNLFPDGKTVIHALYIGGQDFGIQGENIAHELSVELERSPHRPLYLEWEYWDGEDWRIVVPRADHTHGLRRDGTIHFDCFGGLEEAELVPTGDERHGTDQDPVKSRFLRARLLGTEAMTLPSIREIRSRVQVLDEQTLPEGVIVSEIREIKGTEDEYVLEQALDFSRPVSIFGRMPREGNILYLRSPVFSRAQSNIKMRFTLTGDARPAKDLEIEWFCFDKDKKLKTLGTVGPNGVKQSQFALKDETNCFTRSGLVSFKCPEDIGPYPVAQREDGYYVGARLVRGRYDRVEGAEAGSEGPAAHTVLLGFGGAPRDVEHCLWQNYDTIVRRGQHESFEPFYFVPDDDPTIYIPLGKQPSATVHCLYFDIDGDHDALGSRVAWEYLSGESWSSLAVVRDGTDSLSKAGLFEFQAPEDWSAARRFGTEALVYWLRARCITLEHWQRLRFKGQGVYANSVDVVQEEREEDRLGPSNGQPFQVFQLKRSPIVEMSEVLVLEQESPSPDHETRLKAELGDNLVETSDGSLWARWREVDSFYKSKADSRHFIVDLHEGSIVFGDDRAGRIPVTDSRILARYRVADGRRGNVGADSITIIENPLPGVKAVEHHVPAAGGEDPETIQQAKDRGPWELRHGDRAVTESDFEQLAKASSSSVKKAFCFEKDGEVQVIIVPDAREGEYKPLPTNRLVLAVEEHLRARRLINTSIRVRGPEYVPIELCVEVVLTPEHTVRFEAVKTRVGHTLRRFFHPLHGGPDADGWPMGRTLHISELYYELEKIEEIDFVSHLTMRERSGFPSEHIRLSKRAFPYASRVDIRQGISMKVPRHE